MEINNFISRWKLNNKNFAAIQEILQMDDEEGFFIVGWCEQGIISNFVANEVVEFVKRMLDVAETKIKLEVVKLIKTNLDQNVEVSKNESSKLLSINRLYKDRRVKIENQSKWLLFHFLFDLNMVESTFVNKLDK